ncbi:DUF3275 family protein [Comamonas jiangduensis]|uniref:DUF3275 family protein n=1 Tax=Comamonas jiangduensis TaxID=1194168 RepID=UPI003BF85359
MIRIENALLRVKRITSRNGDFCVADLVTDIGEFKVKDQLLDQFQQGEYDCTVWINEIYLYPYVAYGKSITEIRAKLHDLQVLSTGDFQPEENQQSEPDPLDEKQPTVISAQAPSPAPAEPVAHESRWDKYKKPKTAKADDAPAAPAAEPVESTAQAQDEAGQQPEVVEDAQAEPVATEQHEYADAPGFDSSIFDDEQIQAIVNGREVKLDTSVDRALLRRQAAELGEILGYVFDPKRQMWAPAVLA